MSRLKQTIFSLAAILAIGVYLYVRSIFPEFDLQYIRLEQWYALIALSFLYLSVLATPLYSLFPNIQAARVLKDLQKTLIGITFFFGAIHGSIAFFFLLGGFAGLGFLASKFLFGITLSITSLVILGFLVLSMWQKLSQSLGKREWIFKLIYLVGILITVHAVLLGTHFIVLSALIPSILAIALIFLLLLEALRLDRWANRTSTPRFGLSFAISLVLLSIFVFYWFGPNKALPNVGIHAGHNMANMNMTGDASKRYNVSFTTNPAVVSPNQDAQLKFKIYDASSGNEVTDYSINMEKLMHLVIVDSGLKYFSHIHPANSGSEFTITTRFPQSDTYHVYITFQPTGALEQQFGFTLPVGGGAKDISKVPVDSNLTKTFGDYKVTLGTDDNSDFNAAFMTDASQVIKFHLEDLSGKPISDLQPYLGAFGHLVMINEQTYQYIHIHPIAGSSAVFGGPDVKFLPAALNVKIEPGVYRVFGQFKRNDQVFVTDFTIKIN
ncbi:MAG TPA: hypothetical protein VGQ87_03440 [Patescibacteria group bacterium]|jgi:DMSO/TMAO reductase YedYZ heme-binding membrane subunit|nr:hypothetical protein [Patescibacteria group bacterium]